jgi:poly(3-hydroxybutyrate) depolymerase
VRPARLVAILLVTALVGGAAATASRGQPSSGPVEVFYPSGGLRIQAYLYRPAGDGPFPAVIYNHGSRIGRERQESPSSTSEGCSRAPVM